MRPVEGPGSAASYAFCEHCGTYVDPALAGQGKRSRPLRYCPDCGVLSCRNCFPTKAGRCVQCQALVDPALTVPASASAVTTPNPSVPDSPDEHPWPLFGPRSVRHSVRATRLAAVGGVAFLGIVLAFVAIRLRDDDRRGAVAGLTSTPGPTATTPRPSLTPTPSVSATRPSATPRTAPPPPAAGEVSVKVLESVVTPWIDPFGEVRAQVVALVENEGSGRARLPSAESRYTITDASGDRIAGSLFGHAFPSVLEPGERGYLIDTQSAMFVDLADVEKVDVDVAFEPVEAAVAHLEVSDVDWVETMDGLVVSGSVTNAGPETVGAGAVAVVLLAADGSILGAVYDVTDIGRLEPGASVQFSTGYPGTPPINPNRVATTVGVAFEIL